MVDLEVYQVASGEVGGDNEKNLIGEGEERHCVVFRLLRSFEL